ncbi:MAG: sensor histidine kinase [Chloroflexota bacterium]
MLQAQEEERKRIARELHDETAQSLSMLLTHLDLLESHIPTDNTHLQSGFERIAALARRTLDGARALSHDLRPTILDDAGLIAALQWLAAEYQETYGLPVRVDGRPVLPELSSEVEVALFRIAQEALINSCKHAIANQACLGLSVRRGAIRLVVEDDGRGFDPGSVPAPTREGRLGLYGMHERAALLGGRLSIAAAPGGGTRVEVVLPLKATPR